jgi:hypothetical protein
MPSATAPSTIAPSTIAPSTIAPALFYYRTSCTYALLYYRTSFYEVPVVNPLPGLIHDHLNYHHKFLEFVFILHNSVAWFLSSRLALYGRGPPSIRAGSNPVT